MPTAIAPEPTGMTLRLLRTAQRVSVTALARELGRCRQRVTAIEAAEHPTARAVEGYLAALERAAAR